MYLFIILIVPLLVSIIFSSSYIFKSFHIKSLFLNNNYEDRLYILSTTIILVCYFVFDADDLEPAWNDFEELVWPALAKRIPAFEELKLTGGWAGYYDCNRLDNNAVVGKHPKYENVYMASGFTGRGLMQAPGIGRALTELITTGSYQTIDISDFSVERVLGKSARPEPYVL